MFQEPDKYGQERCYDAHGDKDTADKDIGYGQDGKGNGHGYGREYQEDAHGGGCPLAPSEADINREAVTQ